MFSNQLSKTDDRQPATNATKTATGDSNRRSKKKSESNEFSQEETTIGPYDSLVKQAGKWTYEMEAVRDDIYNLQVNNAILLDYLTMAGAEF